MSKTIKWVRPSGNPLEVADNKANNDECIRLGFKRPKGKTEDQIKKEMEEAEELKKIQDELDKLEEEEKREKEKKDAADLAALTQE